MVENLLTLQDIHTPPAEENASPLVDEEVSQGGAP